MVGNLKTWGQGSTFLTEGSHGMYEKSLGLRLWGWGRRKVTDQLRSRGTESILRPGAKSENCVLSSICRGSQQPSAVPSLRGRQFPSTDLLLRGQKI